MGWASRKGGEGKKEGASQVKTRLDIYRWMALGCLERDVERRREKESK